MDPRHDHPAEGPCLPACPQWTTGALRLFGLQRRYAEMLEACRTATRIEQVTVAPDAPGVALPEYLKDGESLVRLNLVVGRDTPEVLLDEWGIRCNLAFRGRRFDCAFPWASVLDGRLRPPERKRQRFEVIAGAAEGEANPSPEPAREGASTPPPERRHLGIIPGGRKD